MLAHALTPPPLPSWESAHVLVVHLPVGILVVTPVLLLLGFLPKVGRGFALAALVLMGIGTVSAYFAVATGEAAAQLVVRTPEISEVLEEHEELAETTRLLFTLLTVLYALILCGPPLLQRLKLVKRSLPLVAHVVAHLVFLVAYLAGLLVLANTAHLGGRLVHELGVQAFL